jgi:hypothetical protein
MLVVGGESGNQTESVSWIGGGKHKGCVRRGCEALEARVVLPDKCIHLTYPCTALKVTTAAIAFGGKNDSPDVTEIRLGGE